MSSHRRCVTCKALKPPDDFAYRYIAGGIRRRSNQCKACRAMVRRLCSARKHDGKLVGISPCSAKDIRIARREREERRELRRQADAVEAARDEDIAATLRRHREEASA